MSPTHGEKPKKLPIPVKLAVGAIAGAFGTTCIFPIDMVKTRLQTSGTGPISIIKNIYLKEGGIRAFYKGLGPNLVGVVPEKSIKLAVNEVLREFFEKPDGSIEVVHEVISGAGAGFVQVIATNPMEIVKIRMQMQALLPPEQRMNAVQVVKNLGIAGMYRGSAATWARDVPYSVVFFPGYAHLKHMFADEKGNNSMASVLLSGTFAGAVSAGAVTPADVIKTRLQMKGGKHKYKDMRTCFSIILKEEGPTAFFKGVVPRMFVVGPLFGLTLLAFETQKAYMIRNGLL